jgi:hypothetical protein
MARQGRARVEKPRFRDTGQHLMQYADRFLVRCPRCERCAVVTPLPREERRAPVRARVVCEACGYNKDGPQATTGGTDLVDWYFHLPLWLQTPCCGDVLWALNEAHLAFLENYVRATLREDMRRDQLPANAIRNQTMASRLPGWIQSGKNRDEILHTIDKLKKTIA